MSLIEAKRAGIHPFCITIDDRARPRRTCKAR